jgi:hypothetical protein
MTALLQDDGFVAGCGFVAGWAVLLLDGRFYCWMGGFVAG